MDEKVLQGIINHTTAEADRPYFILSGAFLAKFAQVEMLITAIIAALSRSSDLEVFQILMKGMDARVKIERLRQLAKHRNGKIGKTLKNHLDYFETKLVPVRNEIAHGAPWRSSAELGKWGVATIATFQLADFDSHRLEEFGRTYQADEFGVLILNSLGLFDELSDVFKLALGGEVLEIKNPRFRLPKDVPASANLSSD